jgi:DNA-binding MarR family transcriptional regulator
LCLATQRAARALARKFDEAFRPLGLTSGQFSLLMALNRMQAPKVSQVAQVLAMDRTTVTAALKPLERDGFVAATADQSDRRVRRLSLTKAGQKKLAAAFPVWEATHRDIDAGFAPGRLRDLRADLTRLAFGEK